MNLRFQWLGFCVLFGWLLPCQSAAQEIDLYQYFSSSNPDLPLVSGHRGGRFYKGLPENSLAVFEHVAQGSPAYIECDVAMSSDSIFFLLHDEELDRTTTGTGKAGEKRWSYLDSLFLVDDFGTVTEEGIPTLEDVIEWAGGTSILALDLKQVPEAYLINFLVRFEAHHNVILIAYTLDQALRLHELAPAYVLSVSIRSMDDLNLVRSSELPLDHLLAFTGTQLPSGRLIESIHALGIPTIMGTMWDGDVRFRAGEDLPYLDLIDHGIMILATDHPLEVHKLLRSDASSND